MSPAVTLASLMSPSLLLADPVTRESARDAARAELSRRQYADAQPPLLLRAIGRALRFVGELFDGAAARVGSGLLARVLLVAVLATVVAVVLVRLGPLGGRGRARPALFGAGPIRTAAGHRAGAEALAAQGRFAEAVRERLRAVVREFEERGVLDPRPGRTAGEVARDAGAAVPSLAEDLRHATGLFDEVWYGGRAADAHTYAALVGVDDRVRSARLVGA